MKNLLITFDNWHWDCGDGCCSESGCVVSAHVDGKQIYKSDNCNFSTFTEGDYIPLYVIVDMFHDIFPDNLIETRKKIINHFCNGIDKQPSFWAYWSEEYCKEKQIKSFFIGLGFEKVTIEYNDEER